MKGIITFIDLEFLLKNYGFRGLMIGSIILILNNIIKSRWISDSLTKIIDSFITWIIKKNLNKSGVEKISESIIRNHDIFNYIDFWMYSKVPTLEFSSEYRTQVFRRYITIYLKSYKNGLNDMILKGEYKEMDESKLKKSILTTINLIIFDYEKRCLEEGIPELIISKMKVKNNENIELALDIINSIIGSNFYNDQNNYLKLYSVLNIFSSILDGVISKSETVCNSINGQLKGSTFRSGGKDYIE
jgi:hypothetical protein